MARALPSQTYLRQCFDYDLGAGTLTWRTRPREHFATERAWKIFNGQFAGAIAGAYNGCGYIVVGFNGRGIFRAHRLIWCWMTGDDPPVEIDHINECKSDNRWGNLRLATHVQNARNRGAQVNNTGGFKGVSLSPTRGKFLARIGVRKVTQHLGAFPSEEEAARAYDAKARELFGEFAVLNFP